MSLLDCPDAAVDLRKCCEFEYILIGDLRDLLEEDLSAQNRRWMLAVLDALLDTLPKEFALKSQDGYLSDVLDEYPSWDRAVERLRQRHLALHRRLTEIRVRIFVNSRFEGIADRLRPELQAWIEAFTDLQQAERKITFAAVNLECGAGD